MGIVPVDVEAKEPIGVHANHADAEISWWVTDSHMGTGLEQALDALVPQWIASTWPFTKPRYIGRDLSWDDWLALPATHPPAT